MDHGLNYRIERQWSGSLTGAKYLKNPDADDHVLSPSGSLAKILTLTTNEANLIKNGESKPLASFKEVVKRSGELFMRNHF